MEKQTHQEKIFQEGMPPASNAGIFGLTDTYENSDLVIIPVPWEATASHGKGTAYSAKGILQASHQLDLEDLRFGRPYENGIKLLDAHQKITEFNSEASEIVSSTRSDRPLSPEELKASISTVNEYSQKVNSMVEEASKMHLNNQKFVAVLGGDHSSPFGLLKALAEQHEDFGILHIDAHFDLRKAYEGFTYSHASIMNNVLESLPQVTRLVQVGIRDFCSFEKAEAERQKERVSVFYDSEIFSKKAEGVTFKELADAIVGKLPEKVYVSFDIDGLNPSYCPGTGTPVPGGIDYLEACYLLEVLAFSGRKIIGFDLCEVASQTEESEWDFNVGARILYKLCGSLFQSQKGRA